MMAHLDIQGGATALLAPASDAFQAEARYREAFIRVGAAVLMLAPIAISVGLAAIGQGFRAALALPVAVVGYVGWRLAREGRIQAGFIVSVYGSWACVLVSAILVNGIEGPVIAGVALILVVVGWLTDKRSVIILTAATPPILFVLAYAQSAGWPLPVRVYNTPYYIASIQSCIMIAAGMLGYFSAETLRAQLRGLRTVRDKLSDTVAQLTQRDEELQRSQTELRALTQLLEERVAERTVKLQAAVKDLEAYASSIAHNLRAPLRAINANARMVQYDDTEIVSDTGRRRLATIERNALQMAQLIDGLLELARVKRVEIERIKIDMRGTAQSAIESLSQLYHGTQVELGDLPPAEGDPPLVRQIFSSLVENALKFSSRSERSRVIVDWDAGRHAWFVRDNGVGFDMSHTANLFGAFERLHGNEYEGSGIGLAIVKCAIERHGGRIWAESGPGGGATFYFTLG